ncbi:MAG: hypothetical protein L0216_17985 [Planctomycetales bacterium]|nr:hypothetical protein [Planctomycetales bacterium]
MQGRFLWTVGFAVALATPAHADGPGDLLPLAPEPWSAGAALLFPPGRPEDLLGPGAAVIAEYGARTHAARVYTHGNRAILLEVHLFSDATGALGYFTARRRPKETSAAFGEEGARSAHAVRLRRGTVYAEATAVAGDAASARALEALAGAVASKAPPAEPVETPALLRAFPPEGKEPGTELHARGPLGIAPRLAPVLPPPAAVPAGSEAASARYALGPHRATLVLVRAPSPEAAAPALAALAEAISKAVPTAAGDGDEQGFSRTDPTGRAWVARRAGPAWAVAWGAGPSVEALGRLADAALSRLAAPPEDGGKGEEKKE